MRPDVERFLQPSQAFRLILIRLPHALFCVQFGVLPLGALALAMCCVRLSGETEAERAASPHAADSPKSE